MTPEERRAAIKQYKMSQSVRGYQAPANQPGQFKRRDWRPLLLVLRTLLAIVVAYVVVVKLVPPLQARNAVLADIGLTVLIGLAFGLLCPEHWVWAAPLPMCVALTQAWGSAHAAAVSTGDEEVAGLLVAYVAYVTLALVPAWFVRLVLDRRGSRSIPLVRSVP